jgi:hypothetical protein
MPLDGIHVQRPEEGQGTMHPLASSKTVNDSWPLTYAYHNSIQRQHGWTTLTKTIDAFRFDCLDHHSEREAKDGPCFVPGKLVGDRRTKTAVAEIHALVLDLDRSSLAELNRIVAEIEASGLGCSLYSTHSHMSSETEVAYGAYHKFCGENGLIADSSEAAQYYLTSEVGYDDCLVCSAWVVSLTRDSEKGVVSVLGHEPVAKARLVFFLDRPYKIIDWMERGFSEADARERLWPAALATFARAFGLRYDTACKDIARAFYAASCRTGAGTRVLVRKFEGKAVSLDAIVPTSPEALDRIIPPETRSKSKTSTQRSRHMPNAETETTKSKADATQTGTNLKAWAAQYAAEFNIEALFKARGLVLAAREAGGYYVKCFQEDAHKSPNPPRTYVVNGQGQKGFTLHCSGSTHQCCHLDRLERVQGYLQRNLIALDDLFDPDYGGGPISARVYREYQRRRTSRCLRVVDKDGSGIDVGILYAAMAGRLDLARLNAICGTQIDADVTAEQLAEFIEAGRVTVAALINCWSHGRTESTDPYTAKLQELAQKHASGSSSGREFDAALQAIADEFKVKTKTIEADYRRIKSAAPSMPGLLSAEEAALVAPHRDYVRDFAIVNTGGKGVVLNLREANLSKAIMPRDDFVFLHQNEWIEVPTSDGKQRTIYPAKEFLRKPPKDAQVYRGGLVFKPSGTVAADEYNLYQGMLVEPDESGCCDLFKQLMREVWAQGDEAVFQWVMEWFMHIIARPGTKVSTSIAIRGDYGDGKSIVTQQLMSAILGDMLLRVANQKLILGDFNEAAMGKLLITLEEAAFAGDKAAFDRLKEQITGDSIVINPKFKAPVVVDNYARMLIVSNHAHFLHMKPGDRRYTVLESSSCWKGSNKFKQLLDQWASGGAARFVYEALNHSFRQFDDGRALIIDTNLKTKSAVRQIAHSRSPLDKCIVSFLLNGKFQCAKPILLCSGGSEWPMDTTLRVESLRLQEAVAQWLRESDGRAGHYEATLHSIIETVERYAGKTEEKRRKGLFDAETGKRPQLPTERLLPARRDALEHARVQGLITDEEYESAGAPVE